jgi:hypothetical protein
VHVEGLLKVLSIPPNPLFSGVSINEEGETVLTDTARSALTEKISAAKRFKLNTPEGLKALDTADLVEKIRASFLQENWGDHIEQVLLHSREFQALPAPEVKAAIDQLSLLRKIEETVANLQKAAQEFDAAMLEVHLAIAQNLRMEGIPPYVELMEKIKAIYAALDDAISSKTMEKLNYGLALANEIGYNRQDCFDTWAVRNCVEGLIKEITAALEIVAERDQLQEILKRCTAIGFKSPETEQMEFIVSEEDEKLFKRQEQAARAANNHPRRRAKTSQLKEIFFSRFGSGINWEKCNVLRSPAEFAKSKIIGKDKTKNSMLVWSKESIPTSLTIIEDKLVLKDAVRNFKNVLGWSGDKTVQYPLMVAQEIVLKGIQFEPMRDEIYVQLIKQLTNNPSLESTTQLWYLMQICLLHFPPTPVFENYLEAWLRLKGGDAHWYTIRTLHDTQENGVRNETPSPEALEAMIKKNYPSTKEPLDVHRPNLPPQTSIDEVVAINNKRHVGSVGHRPSMRQLAGPQMNMPPPSVHSPPVQQHAPPVQEVPPAATPAAGPPPAGVRGAPPGARPLPGMGGRGPPPGY